MIYDSPLNSVEDNLVVAIGAIEFREKTIRNLRLQILALRTVCEDAQMCKDDIDAFQFNHISILKDTSSE